MNMDELKDLSPGERRARHRDTHLCFECPVSSMCRVVMALPTDETVTITNCTAYESYMTPSES